MKDKTLNKAALKTASFLDVPVKAIRMVPEIIITEKEGVCIDGHKGILIYDENMIGVRCADYTVMVYGERLRMSGLNKERIRIVGNITGVTME